MRLLAGVTPEPQSLDALALGSAVANATGAQLVVANIVPRGYDFPGAAHVDAEWRAFLLEQANETLDWARRELPPRPGNSYRLSFDNSSGIGLAEFAKQTDSQVIAIGSTPGGSTGRIEIGSTADQLLHGASTAVAIAPYGYASWAPDVIRRTVVAYQDTAEARHALQVVAEVLSGPEVAPRPIALISVVSQQTRIYGSRLGSNAEDGIIAALTEQAEAAVAQAAATIARTRLPVTAQVLVGRDVANALSRFDWADDDLLVVGSTQRGPLRRVLLGDMSHRIIKAATVPVCVMPRSAPR